jgi:hypothetical protein
MADRLWKQSERAIAKLLGGERVPITGRQRGDVPDVQHSWLSVEVKCRQQLPTWLKDALCQAKAAAKGDQLPIVVLHEEGQRYEGSLVLLTLKDFWCWFGPTDGSAKEVTGWQDSESDLKSWTLT